MASSDPEGSFKSHQAYLHALAMSAGKETFKTNETCLRDLKVQVLTLSKLQRMQGNKQPDLARVKRLLTNAWASELLLGLGREYINDDEVIRLSNNWNVVMAYYIGFHGMHALLAAEKKPEPPTHAKLQRQYVDWWVNTGVQVGPFGMAATAAGVANAPASEVIDLKVHPWTACHARNCFSIGAQALVSTRKGFIEDAETSLRLEKRKARNQAWRAADEVKKATGKSLPTRDWERRSNLTPAEKAEIKAKQRHASYLDYLYRLRLRSNYEDSTMFTEGPTDTLDSKIVRNDLVYLSSAYMLVVEAFIARSVGSAWLATEARRWVKANMPAGVSAGIGLRLSL